MKIFLKYNGWFQEKKLFFFKFTVPSWRIRIKSFNIDIGLTSNVPGCRRTFWRMTGVNFSVFIMIERTFMKFLFLFFNISTTVYAEKNDLFPLIIIRFMIWFLNKTLSFSCIATFFYQCHNLKSECFRKFDSCTIIRVSKDHFWSK